MDSLSEIAVIKLQLEDIEQVLGSQKGKNRVGEIVDNEEAFKTQAAELRSRLTAMEDRTMCMSISRAIQDDGVELSIVRAEEHQALHDKARACELNGHADCGGVCHVGEEPALDMLADDIIEQLTQLNMFDKDHGSSDDDAEIDCSACLTSVKNVESHNVPCSHPYCKDCICRLFEEALKDETLFPPRCCRQEIPLSTVRKIIGAKTTNQAELKAIEIATTNRTYCSNNACSAFILPVQISTDRARCPRCSQETCTRCKRLAHEADCAASLEAEVLQIAAEAGWQRCYQCRTLVELNTGCNHITCRCGAQFCYTCGARWKTCTCAQWDEHRLLDRAAAIINRDARGPGPARPAPEALRVMANRIRDRHECDHRGVWRRVQGRNRCEECSYILPDFILECRQCMLRACMRCRRNRL